MNAGSSTTGARFAAKYADMVFTSIVLSWVNYETDLAYWISDVLPVMEQAGLRRPYVPAHARS